MGISGLTTFIRNDSYLYMEKYKLHDSNVVIDGYSIAFGLYEKHVRCNDCFGGDYDKYAAIVKTFFQLLREVNVTPYVIMDGAYEKRKMNTILARMRSRVREARYLNVDKGHIFPLLLSETFRAVMKEMNVKHVTCDFEGDTEVASLAKDLNCPMMSSDSDYYIFDALYIPFPNVSLKITFDKEESFRYIPCRVYRIDKFVYLNNLDKHSLPILAVLLGNDYIKKTVFSISEDSENCPTQERIESAIKWLQNETRDSAINKILSKYDSTTQQVIAKQIDDAIKGYDLPNSSFIQYFHLEGWKIQSCRPQKTNLIPAEFITKYRNCNFSSGIMNLFTQHKYFYYPKAEDHTLESAHKISFKIMAAIHKILTSLTKLTCVARFDENDIKNYEIECDLELPKFEEISSIPQDLRRDILLKILGIDTCFVDQCLKNFPSSWHILLIALKYVSLKDYYVYSIVLCAIILGHNEKQNNFNRLRGNDDRSELSNCFVMRKYDLVLCVDKLLPLFFVNPDLRENNDLYQRRLVHHLSEYQSVLMHIVNLNTLLDYPFQILHIHNCYNGTFLYNIVNDLQHCENLDDYVRTLIGDYPTIQNCFEMTICNLKKTVLNK